MYFVILINDSVDIQFYFVVYLEELFALHDLLDLRIERPLVRDDNCVFGDL